MINLSRRVLTAKYNPSLFQTSSILRNFMATKTFILPDIGEGILEVELMEWFKKVGDDVKEDDYVCEVMSDKANVEISSKYTGKISKTYAEVGDMVQVGSALMDIEVEGEDDSDAVSPSISAIAPISNSKVGTTSPTDKSRKKVLATPAVRAIARENHLDLSNVVGTGRDGRIMKGDILSYLNAGSTTASQTPLFDSPTPVFTGETKRVPITGMGRAMVKSMTLSNTIPQFGVHDEYESDRLISVRKNLKNHLEKSGIRLTFMPLFIKSLSIALKDYPIINSSVNEDVTEIIYHPSHNIGIALDSPNGLVVPCIKNCESKSIVSIAQDLSRLIDTAAAGKITGEDLANSTISISSIGNLGGSYARPLILPPHSAIVALGQMQESVVLNENNLPVRRNRLPVSWSADHRIIDGATLVKFSNRWKDLIENPEHMLLDLA